MMPRLHIVREGESAGSIAAVYTGAATEGGVHALVAANPQKATTLSEGTKGFKTLHVGEHLHLPPSWPNPPPVFEPGGSIGVSGVFVTADSLKADATTVQGAMRALEQIFQSCPQMTAAQQVQWLAFDKAWRDWYANEADPSWYNLGLGKLQDQLDAYREQVKAWQQLANTQCGAKIPVIVNPSDVTDKPGGIGDTAKEITTAITTIAITAGAVYLGVEFGPMIVGAIKSAIESRRARVAKET